MKQHLGIFYTINESPMALISTHLVRYQGAFGGMELAKAVYRNRRESLRCVDMLDTHISNLFETFGKREVLKIYELIYKMPVNKSLEIVV